jgi:cell division topological specificity factor MinE
MFGNLAKRLFGSKAASNSVAKSRLHFVLVQDRAGLSAEEMGKFRKELSEVIERYFVIDAGKFDIAYERTDDMTTLVINSPVVAKRSGSTSGSSPIRGAKTSPKGAVSASSSPIKKQAAAPNGVANSGPRAE